jgi:hypothetical protein
VTQTIVKDYDKMYHECVSIDRPIDTGFDSTIGSSSSIGAYDSLRAIACCMTANIHQYSASNVFNWNQVGVELTLPTYSDQWIAGPVPWIDASCTGPFTTARCDDVPRALCSPNPGRTNYYVKQLSTRIVVTTSTISFTPSAPSCRYQMDDCTLLYHHPLFKNITSDIVDKMDKYEKQVEFPKADQGHCNLLANYDDQCNECNRLSGRGNRAWIRTPDKFIQLLLWHKDLEASEDALCHLTETNLESLITSLNLDKIFTDKFITHSSTWTLTYPTIYAFFKSIYINGCGSPHTDVLAPLQLTDLRTPINGDWGGNFNYLSFVPLNLHHWGYKTLEQNNQTSYPLIPWSIYSNRRIHLGERTIYQDYDEQVLIRLKQSVLSSIDPLWNKCGDQEFNWADPPVILTAIEATLDSAVFKTLQKDPDVQQTYIVPGGAPSVVIPTRTAISDPISGSSQTPKPAVIVSIINDIIIQARPTADNPSQSYKTSGSVRGGVGFQGDSRSGMLDSEAPHFTSVNNFSTDAEGISRTEKNGASCLSGLSSFTTGVLLLLVVSVL